MACITHRDADGKILAITCLRGRVAVCEVPGCNRPHTKLCDYAVTTTRKSGTCDMKLCGAHATKQLVDEDFCPPHAAFAKAAKPIR